MPIGDPSRSDQEYVWISNASNLPLFVERVYPGLESARKALNVNVRIAGPTAVDLAAFITTVDAECTKNPAGVIVVGGWDDALASEVDKCIDKQVPTIVTDGDLPMSKRLTYLGTNWYNLGYQHGQYQCRYHAEAGLQSGQIGTISFLAASNFIQARQGLRDALAKECPGVEVVADEESGTNVEQVAANTAAIIQGHPDLTGMVGFDSEAGPGIVRAVTESGKAGQIIITSNEAGRDFLNTIKDGTVKMINMEKYETMDFFGVLYLYTFHNDIIRNLNMDHWLQNPLPAIGDSGLIFVTADNVDTILEATDPASPKAAPAGLDVPFGDPSRSDQEYVWISNASNLPLFVERVYPGLESARKALNVNVRIAGPTAVDLAAFITTVDAECTKNPAGVIVVGGWDDALASEVDKCIDKQVPTIVTDGDLPMSKRLTYLGTNWYNLGYQHGQYQCRYHAEAGLEAGEIGTISFLAASNFIQARQGLRDALAAECPDVEVVADEESGTNVEQVAANTAAIIQGHPDLTGMVGFDSEAGPGHCARRHRVRQGRPDHHHLERGRPRLPEHDQGRHGQDDQHGEVRDDGLLRRLVSLHLPQRHHPQPEHGSLAAEPAAGDRRLGLDLRHRGQCRHDPRGDERHRVTSASRPRTLREHRALPGTHAWRRRTRSACLASRVGLERDRHLLSKRRQRGRRRMERRFAGKVALVTGATNGIGRATAVRLAAEGALVGVNQKPTGDPSETLRLVKETGGEAFPVVADMRDPDAVTAMVHEVARRGGRLDYVVSNAAINPFMTWDATSIEDFDRLFETNVRGTWVVCTEAAKQMVKEGHGGAVVMVSSISAHVGAPEQVAYCGTKGAISMLGKALGAVLGKHGIRVNVVEPGAVATNMSAPMFDMPDVMKYYLERIALHRIADPSELAATIAFLLSDDASYVTSATLLVDAGFIVNAEL